MEFKQSTFEEIVESERDMLLLAEKRYGAYYVNASEFNLLLNQFIVSVDPDRYIFAMFLSQVKKHVTLALFSTLRLHHTQALMDLRQVLEAGSCAGYAIANLDSKDFADVNENGMLEPSQELTKKRYVWLDKNYTASSTAIHKMKKSINSTTAHSNIVYAHNNFQYEDEKGRFSTPFFDIENEYHVKTDLWTIANITMCLVDLFYGIAKNHGGIVFSDDYLERLKKIEAENHRLKAEMMNTEQYKDALKRTEDKIL